jgi:hypothetical protein
MLWTLALAMFGMSVAAPASAQNVTAANPQSIASVIQGKGFKTEITKDDGGDPMIKADGNGVKFIVLFYGCTANKDCTTISFYAGWSGSEADVNKVNEWNRGQRFGRAYIDKENDPCIEMDVDLDDGGMSRILFEDNVEFWMSVMSAYSKFIYE